MLHTLHLLRALCMLAQCAGLLIIFALLLLAVTIGFDLLLHLEMVLDLLCRLLWPVVPALMACELVRLCWVGTK